MSTHSASFKVTTVTTGNEELDVRLGGGVPVPSLVVIEGDNGTGKTVLSCQLAKGFLISNIRVMYVTTESTIKQFLEHAKNINIDLAQPFLRGYLSVVPALIESSRWSRGRVRSLIKKFVEYVKEKSGSYGVVIVDSASLLLHYVSDSDVHSLLSDIRSIVKRGTTFIMTLHPAIVSDRVVKELTAVSDVYFKLAVGEIGGRVVKVINVVKIRGAPTLAESSIAFDVDPAFGLKVVPLALAKA